jgi:hypothetical protein
VVATYSVVEHGGGSIAAVQARSVHDLTAGAPAYEGATVTTYGRLAYSEEHDRYELVDEVDYSIIIREYDNEAELADLEGRWVTVAGKFGADRENGIYIDATSVHLSEEPTAEPE